MVKLTEEMVIARTRNSDFSNVKKLNCWGTELTDVSILRKMKNVQVLSLSVNNIESLADFQYCLNLQDLFVRKNNIKDLNQVCYLQALPNLRNLWLGENPCAETEGYRLAVLRALPNLEKLDDKDVMIEEVQAAMQRGRVLIHPLDVGASLTPQQQSQPPSPEDEIVAEYIEEPELERHRRYSSSSDQKSYEDQQPTQEEYRDTDRRNANYNSSPQYLENNKYSNNEDYDDRLTSTSARQNGDYDERRTYSSNYDNSLSRPYVSPRSQYPPQIESAPLDDRRVPVERNSEYEDGRIQHPIDYEDLFPAQVQVLPQLSNNTKRNVVHQSLDRDDTNKMQGWVRHSEKEKCRSQFHYHRRPVTRNSNILSAVLCLVKELDYPSLEVVEMAVRNRMDELEE